MTSPNTAPRPSARPANITRPSNIAAALFWMAVALASFILVAISGRAAGKSIDTMHLMFYRSAIGLLIITAFILFSPAGFSQIKTRRLGLHALRNSIHFIAQYSWLAALMLIPLAQLFAIEFTAPLWVALLAPFLLGERLTLIRIIAAIIGFTGILVIVQPVTVPISPGTLYAMRNRGMLEVVSRGVYRLSGSNPLGNPDLVTVATRIPSGVICLISALAFHDLTTQIPHEVHVALPRGAEEPRLDHPPIKTYRFSGGAYTDGIEIHELDGVSVCIYSPEKTLADCFKFRNRIGLDTAVEAIRFYRERRFIKVDALMHYASVCRVKKIIRPYLEAIL